MIPLEPSISPIADRSEIGRLLFKSALAPMAIVDVATDRIIGVSATCARLFGYEPGEAFGRRAVELGIFRTSEDRARLVAPSEKTGSVRDLPVELRHRNGSEMQLHYSGEIVQLGGKRYLHVVFQDAEVRQLAGAAQARLEERQRLELLGQRAAGIAHDMNNVLTCLTMTLGIANAEAENPEEVRKCLEISNEACKRATELVRQILTYCRSGQPERSPIHIQSVVAETLRMIRTNLPASVVMDAQIDPLTPMVLANACQIQEVLLNLSNNAVRAMRDRVGRLTVQLDTVKLEHPAFENFPDLRPGPYLRLTVRDTGSGMSAPTAKRIFEPFFTTKRSSEGFGLGLAVVRNIVKDHEGAVTVQTLEGIGTEFAVYLPIHRVDKADVS